MNETPQEIFENFETVEEPNLVLALTTLSSIQSAENEGHNCQTVVVQVRPFNDLGSGLVATDTVFQLTRDGKLFI